MATACCRQDQFNIKVVTVVRRGTPGRLLDVEQGGKAFDRAALILGIQ